ncbi:MAG: 3-hydroxyacyl-CoA dehydrogenase family protein [Thermoleophilia bacterium]
MIARMAVLGAGVMGSEIAWVAASGGLDVQLLDSDPAALDRGLAHIAKIGARAVKRGKATEEEVAAIVARVTPTSDSADLGIADMAIEAVPEILDVKRAVVKTLDRVLPPGALIASNTSGLSIAALGRETSRPELVLGLHFFNPASVMKLVEVIQGEGTSPETAAAGEELARALGKVPVRVKECPGFLVNRILVRAMSEAYRLAEELGADRAAADAATVAGGPAPMGPFALGDLVGLDTLDHIQKDLQAAYGDRFADGGQVGREVAAGRLGRKSGAGFYEGLPPEGAEADEAGLAVARRYYESAFDEARRCLDEEIAAEDDVDTAMCYGCGWSEGPLAWARERKGA